MRRPGPLTLPVVLLTLSIPGSSATSAASPARTGDSPPPLTLRTDEFAGWFHDAGQLLLHVSNRGFLGRDGGDLTAPSAEWPAGSDHTYLYAAGLWVGGIVGTDTMVTSSPYQFGEFYNHETEGCGNPPRGICETAHPAVSGMRHLDDDGDGRIDEDPLDGRDNDADGRIDEDFAAISQQMFRTSFYDSSTFYNQFHTDEIDDHHPLGLEVTQESYVWSHPMLDDFVGVEYHIRNASREIDGVGWEIRRAYVGMLVDSDVGIDDFDLNFWEDDLGGLVEVDTTVAAGADGLPFSVGLRMGTMYDGQSNPSDAVPGYLGVMLLGHTVDTTSSDFESSLAPRTVGLHVFRLWESAGDARDDLDRYQFMKGLSDTGRTIDPPSSHDGDWRYLITAGPFVRFPPGSTIVLQLGFVGGEMVEVIDPGSGLRTRVPDLTNAIQAQRVYDGFRDEATGQVVHWTGNLPPRPPSLRVTAGNGRATIEWDDFPEGTPDALTGEIDFAGYRIQRLREPENVWGTIAEFDTLELAAIDTGNPGLGRYRVVDRGLRNFHAHWYRIRSWDREGLVSAPSSPVRVTPRADSEIAPEIRVLPNPVRGTEPLRFLDLPPTATVRIYSVTGKLVTTIQSPPGATELSEVEWRTGSAASGIYVYRISTREGPVQAGKLVVLR